MSVRFSPLSLLSTDRRSHPFALFAPRLNWTAPESTEREIPFCLDRFGLGEEWEKKEGFPYTMSTKRLVVNKCPKALTEEVVHKGVKYIKV